MAPLARPNGRCSAVGCPYTRPVMRAFANSLRSLLLSENRLFSFFPHSIILLLLTRSCELVGTFGQNIKYMKAMKKYGLQ